MTSEDIWGEGQVQAELRQLQRRGNWVCPGAWGWAEPPLVPAVGRACCGSWGPGTRGLCGLRKKPHGALVPASLPVTLSARRLPCHCELRQPWHCVTKQWLCCEIGKEPGGTSDWRRLRLDRNTRLCFYKCTTPPKKIPIIQTIPSTL